MNKSITFLLIDDDIDDTDLFQDVINDVDPALHFISAVNGQEALELLTNRKDALPDLIFLDLNMPRKNGLTCLKEIRSNDKLKDVAVAIYSTSSYEKDIDETFHHGANVYIKKPTDFDTLKKVLHKVLSAAYVYREPPFSIENFLLKL